MSTARPLPEGQPVAAVPAPSPAPLPAGVDGARTKAQLVPEAGAGSMRRIVIAHGGTGSDPKEKDGTDRAVEAGMRALKEKDPIEAVVAACMALEDDERFNAGTGSNFRFDGKLIEMDAAVIDSRARYGAVTAIRDVKNPVRIAQELMALPTNIVAGDAAIHFARARGYGPHDPRTQKARMKWQELVEQIKKGEDSKADNEWDFDLLRRNWNYETPFEEVFGPEPPARRRGGKRVGASDTIGAVATDGKTFAAGTSTGGTISTLRGRVGDTANIGAGIFAGEFGAIAVTGNGDHILRERAATMIHRWLADNMKAEAALRRLTATFADETDVWAAVVGLDSRAGGGNREIAWSMLEETGNESG